MLDTRQKFISVATAHFARRGFYGASIADISGEVGLSKQALLHHFGTKEKLYGEVLKQISNELTQNLQVVEESIADPDERVERAFKAVFRAAAEDLSGTQLIVRELLDNKRRAQVAQTWYLSPFLDYLLSLIRNDERAETISETKALAIVYQILGAIHYFLISEPTLSKMYGKETYASLVQSYETEIGTMVTARLAFLAAQKI